ncbi:MAG: NAD(P)-dependent oxidoreductase [Bacteroidetes bacterium]|nr:NAD(P)-dependent oxidoreductase [Bacteroidota bacterium]MBS1650195.1 NAD(P)-dependent oxidoreductase [Bacteroidota bacterium]
MKVLITGSNGFLGQHLTLFLSKQYTVIAISRGENRIAMAANFVYETVDLINETMVAALLKKHQPDVIIHNAAMSKPDECNNYKDMCWQQNVDATGYLLKHCLPSTHFIYVSTDFIFGENGPHSEEDAKGPLNFYGESKLQAEHLLEKRIGLNTIIRPVFIYGQVLQGMRPSFLQWVKSNLEQGKQIKVVSDQQRTPTYVIDICKGVQTIIEQKEKGVYHLAGKDIVSPYEMAITVADVLKLNKNLIENVTSETFPEPVKRAKKSGLKIDKARRELQYNPVSFAEGVKLSFNL